MDRASSMLRDMLVWDGVWPWEPWCGNTVARLHELHAAGWSHVSLTVAGDSHSTAKAIERIAALRCELQQSPQQFRLIGTVQDVFDARAAGLLAVSLHLEGTRCFERNVDLVDAFYQLGIRHTLLAFNNPNSAGGGCAEEDGGLTRFGRRLIGEMERVGMLLDLSHTGPRTSMQALEVSTQPVIFSHSNAAAVTPHWRNVQDQQILACVATGGLIGISGSSGYLGDSGASTDSLFRHLDYLVELAGLDHVGFGFDIVFDAAPLNNWVRTRPDEWPEATDPSWPGFQYMAPGQLAELIERMLAAGYSDSDIRSIAGGNFVRICKAVWK